MVYCLAGSFFKPLMPRRARKACSQKGPEGVAGRFRHRPSGHGWPLWAAWLQDFRAQEISGIGAPFSLVLSFGRAKEKNKKGYQPPPPPPPPPPPENPPPPEPDELEKEAMEMAEPSPVPTSLEMEERL